MEPFFVFFFFFKQRRKRDSQICETLYFSNQRLFRWQGRAKKIVKWNSGSRASEGCERGQNRSKEAKSKKERKRKKKRKIIIR